jgi:hypothetical protein
MNSKMWISAFSGMTKKAGFPENRERIRGKEK